MSLSLLLNDIIDNCYIIVTWNEMIFENFFFSNFELIEWLYYSVEWRNKFLWIFIIFDIKKIINDKCYII